MNLHISANNPFRWDRDFSDDTLQLESHYDDVYECLHETISVFSEKDVRELFLKLSGDAKIRLARSPSVYELLQNLRKTMSLENREEKAHRTRSCQAELSRYILAEAHRAGLITQTQSSAYWTANRDYVTDEALGAVITLRSGAVLDYDSYVHHVTNSSIRGYSYSEAREYANDLDAALVLIEKASPNCYSLIKSYCKQVLIRKDLSRSEMSNTSHDYAIGRILCDNIQAREGSLAPLIDFLIHESIHQYLFALERSRPFISSLPDLTAYSDRRDIYSPWSGNPLDLSSFTHAVVVWYGLFHFWDLLLKSGSCDGDLKKSVLQRKETAISGFVWEQDILRNIGFKKELIEPEHRRFILECQAEVLSCIGMGGLEK